MFMSLDANVRRSLPLPQSLSMVSNSSNPFDHADFHLCRLFLTVNPPPYPAMLHSLHISLIIYPFSIFISFVVLVFVVCFSSLPAVRSRVRNGTSASHPVLAANINRPPSPTPPVLKQRPTQTVSDKSKATVMCIFYFHSSFKWRRTAMGSVPALVSALKLTTTALSSISSVHG